jgi:hypothetical protein
MDISEKATRANIASYYDPVPMPGGYDFDHVRTISRIDLYYNGKFESGEYDNQGFRKYFYNVSKPACDVATKFIDLDTKDITLYPENDLNSDFSWQVWLMQRDLKNWLKQQHIAALLNEIGIDYPKYGSVVTKSLGKTWKKVDIHNLRMAPNAKTLEDSPFVYELLAMTPREMEEMGWDEKALADLMARGMDASYTVYECYDRNPNKGKKWIKTIRADLYTSAKDGSCIRSTEAEFSKRKTYISGIVLYRAEVDKTPYRELHFEKLPGRWLGLGFVEYLFDNQIRRNEVVNVKAKGLYYTSLKIYQTKDQTVGSNILTEVDNGDILKVNSEIVPVANEERNLAYFNEENKDWDQNVVNKTFTTDVARGDALPSRTPLGVANLQASMVSSFFELKRENYGIFLRGLILEDIIPSFEDDATKEHILMFKGSHGEMEKLRKAVVAAQVAQAAWDYATKTGFFPDEEWRKAEENRLLEDANQSELSALKIPRGFYRDAKYVVDVNVTNEQIDSGSITQTLMTTLQILGTNPAIVQNPQTRGILFKMLAMAGVSPVDLDLLEQEMGNKPTAELPQGGSVSVVPSGIANPNLIPKKQVI